MHEFAVTKQVLDIVLEEAQKVSWKKVDDVKIVVGSMRGLVPDSIKFYFNYFSEGTIAEKTVLNFELKPTIAECKNCGEKFNLEEISFFCKKCGSYDLNILQGEEFYIESINGS